MEDDFQPIADHSSDSSTLNSTRTPHQLNRKCTQCGSRSETIYQKEASSLTFILSAVSIFFFGFWSIFTIPVIIAATQMVTKRCYDCESIVEKHNLFSLPSFNDQILNFRFGSFAFVVSRKYAYIILAIFIVLFTVITLTSEPTQSIDLNSDANSNQLQIGSHLINKTWQDFVRECGSMEYVDNSVRANSHYSHIYHENIVQWEGVFTECFGCPSSGIKAMRQGMEFQLGIKMRPTDSVNADLLLRFQYADVINLKDELVNLDPLNIYDFEAKFEFLGNERFPHRLHIIKFKKTGRTINSLDEIEPFYQQD